MIGMASRRVMGLTSMMPLMAVMAFSVWREVEWKYLEMSSSSKEENENEMEKKKRMSRKSKARGCLMGAIVGRRVGLTIVMPEFGIKKKFFPLLEDIKDRGQWVVGRQDILVESAQWILEQHGFEPTAYARNLGKMYGKENMYKKSIGKVYQRFHELPDEPLPTNQLYEIAQSRFGGYGSYGNGAAVRIAPVVLYYSSRWQDCETKVEECVRLTHAHPRAILANILLARCLFNCLKMDPKDVATDVDGFLFSFLDDLHVTIKNHHLEARGKTTEQEVEADRETLCWTIREMYKFLCTRPWQYMSPDQEVYFVTYNFGNGESATRSIPTAIYAFIRGMCRRDSFPEIAAFAGACGGDTENIVAMVGAIAGGYLGEDNIPERWRETIIDNRDGIGTLAEKLDEVLRTEKSSLYFLEE